MASERWVRRSRNAWRFRVWLTAVAAVTTTGAAMVLAMQGVVPAGLQVPLAWIAVWASLFAAAWFASAFRCRRCGTRVGLWYATHAHGGFWLSAFLSARACPVCRH
jgi:hypothetical protein